MGLLTKEGLARFVEIRHVLASDEAEERSEPGR